jgi:hypothetical protein
MKEEPFEMAAQEAFNELRDRLARTTWSEDFALMSFIDR